MKLTIDTSRGVDVKSIIPLLEFIGQFFEARADWSNGRVGEDDEVILINTYNEELGKKVQAEGKMRYAPIAHWIEDTIHNWFFYVGEEVHTDDSLGDAFLTPGEEA